MIRVSDNRALNFLFRRFFWEQSAHRCVGGSIKNTEKLNASDWVEKKRWNSLTGNSMRQICPHPAVACNILQDEHMHMHAYVHLRSNHIYSELSSRYMEGITVTLGQTKTLVCLLLHSHQYCISCRIKSAIRTDTKDSYNRGATVFWNARVQSLKKRKGKYVVLQWRL